MPKRKFKATKPVKLVQGKDLLKMKTKNKNHKPQCKDCMVLHSPQNCPSGSASAEEPYISPLSAYPKETLSDNKKRMIELAKSIQSISYMDKEKRPPEWMGKMQRFVNEVRELTNIILNKSMGDKLVK